MRLAFVVLLLLTSSACRVDDPCTVGSLFESVQQVDPSSATKVVALLFQEGSASLPSGYFAAVTPSSRGLLNPSNDARWVVPEAASLVGPNRFEVILPRTVEAGVRFRLGFPDRRATERCQWQPARDEYVLDVTIDRSAAGYFFWQELVLVGVR